MLGLCTFRACICLLHTPRAPSIFAIPVVIERVSHICPLFWPHSLPLDESTHSDCLFAHFSYFLFPFPLKGTLKRQNKLSCICWCIRSHLCIDAPPTFRNFQRKNWYIRCTCCIRRTYFRSVGMIKHDCAPLYTHHEMLRSPILGH